MRRERGGYLSVQGVVIKGGEGGESSSSSFNNAEAGMLLLFVCVHCDGHAIQGTLLWWCICVLFCENSTNLPHTSWQRTLRIFQSARSPPFEPKRNTGL